MAQQIFTNEILIGREFPARVIDLIQAAKESIDIIVFDWRWYPSDVGSISQKFNQAIIAAARRGVDIRAIVNQRDIFQILKEANCHPKILTTRRKVHIKLMILDGRAAIMGSHNYTISAFELNHEASVVLYDEPAVERLKLYFNNLFF